MALNSYTLNPGQTELNLKRYHMVFFKVGLGGGVIRMVCVRRGYFFYPVFNSLWTLALPIPK